jgi:hypothetical protein
MHGLRRGAPRRDAAAARDARASPAAATTLAGAQAQAIHGLRGQGQPLPAGERGFFEPRLGADLSQVRLHTGTPAARLAGSLSARAFAVGPDVVFGAGQYRPGTLEGRRLLAHELTHVLQQGRGAGQTLRRVIELRPPGRGEASAFARAGELVDRLNSLTRALHYTLDGRVLRCEVLDESRLNEFDRRMQALIGLEAVLPMRLITSAGRTEDNPGSGFQPVVHDTWTRAYVDLDDLLASDALGFKTQMVHILTERAETRNYAARIGSSTFTLAEYERAHGRAYQAETRVLRDEIGDNTLTYRYSEENPPGTWRVVFGSREGYRIVKVFRHFQRERVAAETYALDKKGRRMTIEELIAWRQQNTAGGGAASAAPAHASAPVPPAARHRRLPPRPALHPSPERGPMQTLARLPPVSAARAPALAALRPKLRLGHAQDEAEHQADRLAARALGLAGPVALPAGDAQAQRAALRQVLGHGPRPTAHSAQPTPPAADAPAPDEDAALPEALERELHALQAGGQPLPPPLRAEMEARFGLDLSGVRLHTGARAARLNQALGAHAFALGEHIAFDAAASSRASRPAASCWPMSWPMWRSSAARATPRPAPPPTHPPPCAAASGATSTTACPAPWATSPTGPSTRCASWAGACWRASRPSSRARCAPSSTRACCTGWAARWRGPGTASSAACGPWCPSRARAS